MDSVDPELVKQLSISYEDDHSSSGRCKYQGRFACSVTILKTSLIPLSKTHLLFNQLESQRKVCPNHVSLLQFLGCAIDSVSNIVCLNELVLGDYLHSFLNKQPKFTLTQLPLRVKIAEGIASGLSFLHGKGIILLNLHSRSIILDHDDDFSPRIVTVFEHEILDAIDESKEISRGPLELYWKPPELRTKKFSTGSFSGDLYSLGVVLWEIASAGSSFNPKSLFKTPKVAPNALEFDSKYTSTMLLLLDPDPDVRISSSDAALIFNQLAEKYPYIAPNEETGRVDSAVSSHGNAPTYTYKKEELESIVDRAVLLYSKKEYVAAAQLFDIPAWNGNAKAQYYLGLIHMSGQGRERNFSLACGWLERASEKGWIDAEYHLALLHFFQIHSNFGETREGGFYNLEKLSRAGHIQSKIMVASCYEIGKCVIQDVLKARVLYEEVANIVENPLVFYRIGALYENSTPPDNAKAFLWYQRGATEGHVHCEYHLALCYHYGRGVAENPVKAMEWYASASRQNHPAALYVIGHKYFKGQGLERPDPVLATNYYKDAGFRGNTKAQQALAHIYEKGLGIPSNLKLSAFWYHKAAASGDPYAQNNLGRFYQNGIGVETNLARAAKLYKKSAAFGIMQAQVNYARCLEMGLGLEAPDPTQAFIWYQKAAEQNSPHAQFKLAHCYYRGIGVKPDSSRALALYQKSADSGYHRAIDKLKQLNLEPKANINIRS